MINQPKALKLIKIYSIICDRFEKDLKYTCERFSNNDKQYLTDQEIMTIYLFAVQEEQRFRVSAPPTPLLLRLKKITTNLYRLDAAVVCRSLIF